MAVGSRRRDFVEATVDEVASATPDVLPIIARIEAVRARWAVAPADPDADPEAPRPADIAMALLGWAVPYRTIDALRTAIAARRTAMRELCRDDAPLTFA
ncbi:MAG TPA: hypothetical protein VHM48_11945, partial [Candidatus Limnocylindrales bacterium]|nr:hypothetical protein [Candidatus Limnocylindrales bacterium]